jgi:hypothetical protein
MARTEAPSTPISGSVFSRASNSAATHPKHGVLFFECSGASRTPARLCLILLDDCGIHSPSRTRLSESPVCTGIPYRNSGNQLFRARICTIGYIAAAASKAEKSFTPHRSRKRTPQTQARCEAILLETSRQRSCVRPERSCPRNVTE